MLFTTDPLSRFPFSFSSVQFGPNLQLSFLIVISLSTFIHAARPKKSTFPVEGPSFFYYARVVRTISSKVEIITHFMNMMKYRMNWELVTMSIESTGSARFSLLYNQGWTRDLLTISKLVLPQADDCRLAIRYHMDTNAIEHSLAASTKANLVRNLFQIFDFVEWDILDLESQGLEMGQYRHPAPFAAPPRLILDSFMFGCCKK